MTKPMEYTAAKRVVFHDMSMQDLSTINSEYGEIFRAGAAIPNACVLKSQTLDEFITRLLHAKWNAEREKKMAHSDDYKIYYTTVILKVNTLKRRIYELARVTTRTLADTGELRLESEVD